MKSQDKQAEIDLLEKLVATDSYAFELGLESRQRQLQMLPLALPQQRILDAGCGPGTYGVLLAQRGHEVVGVDISAQAIGTAKKRAEEKMVRFLPLVGDLERLPFKDESFDVCFCGYTLHHFPDIEYVVAEFARTLKPNGKLILIEPNGSHIAVRLSKAVEGLARNWLFDLGIDSPNETLHRHTVYASALERLDFVRIEVNSISINGLPPLPTKPLKRSVDYRAGMLLIRILARLRLLFYAVTSEVLSRPLNGIDLVITASKRA